MLQRIVDAQDLKTIEGQAPGDMLFFGDADFSAGVFGANTSGTNLGAYTNPSYGFTPATTIDEPIRQALLDLLPSQRDATTICTHTMAWMLELQKPPGAVWRPNKPTSFRDIHQTSHFDALKIARSLLFFAISLQQLSPDFDSDKLDMGDGEHTVKTYVRSVTSMVLSDDDLACSVEGLECLLLLGMIHVNDFSLRKAWLVFRRAVDIARLQGFHESYTVPPDRVSDYATFQRHLWVSAVMSDCYCSLLLGLETSVGTHPFGSEDAWNDTLNDPDAIFLRRTYVISNQLSQLQLFKLDRSMDTSKGINEALDQLEDSMPQSWWRVPALGRDRSLRSAYDHERYLCQLWFFQLRILTNLPYALRSLVDHEPDVEVFKDNCLEAARNILHRYLGLRQAGASQLHCRVFDLGAFLAATTIILASLAHNRHHEPTRRGRRQRSDMILVEQVTDSLAALGEASHREKVAARSAELLNALLEIADNPDCSGQRGRIRELHDSDFKKDFSESSGQGDARGLLVSVFRKAAGTDGPARRVIDRALAPSEPDPLATASETTLLYSLLEDNPVDWET